MSRSDNGKCPDKGQWCGCIREICEGDCGALDDERKDAKMSKMEKALKEIFDRTAFAEDEVTTVGYIHKIARESLCNTNI